MLFENGETIVFTGDSVTDADRGRPIGEGLWAGVGNGYVRTVDSILNAFCPEEVFHIVNTGSAGDNVINMQWRWKSDVLDLNPQHVFLCIGINDVWRQFDSPGCVAQHVYPKDYREKLINIFETTLAYPSVKTFTLMTPYYMEPNPEDFMRKRMDEYGVIVKEVAAQFNLECIDLQAVFTNYLQYRHSSYLTWDRVHPSQPACMLIAKEILKRIDFDTKKLFA